MNLFHISLDLETWGTTPGSDIRSIGATVFDPDFPGDLVGTHHTALPTFYIACDNPPAAPCPLCFNEIHSVEDCNPVRKYNLTRDPQTVQWWNEQSDDAQGAFDNPVDLAEALQQFTNWFNLITDGVVRRAVRLWCNGQHFDEPILRMVYHACGMVEPWHYRAPRDNRTIIEAAGFDPYEFMGRFRYGTPHNALDDAIGQAMGLCEAFAAVRCYKTRCDTIAARADVAGSYGGDSDWLAANKAAWSIAGRLAKGERV